MGGPLVDIESDYDACDDIISNWGCCYQNYKMFIDKHGTDESVAQLAVIANTCSDDNSEPLCPCANNLHPGNVNSNYTVCRGTSVTYSISVILSGFVLCGLHYA